MNLYSYQQAAVNAIFSYFYGGGKGHPLVVAPTGSGKSHILAGFCAEVHKRFPKEHVLILTHTKEIIQQDAKIMRQYLPPELVGVYSSGLQSRQLRQFNVASIQSVYRKTELFSKYNLIIVDEAHMIPEKGEGRYRTFINSLPGIKIVGLTATPFRRGHGMLTEGHLFDKIVYEIEVQKLIDLGKLSTLTSKTTDYTANLKGVKKIGGDYSKADLRHKLDHNHITDRIVQELLAFKDTHKSWMIFAIDIEHCEHIAHALHMAGITSVAIHSKLDLDRKELLDMFKRRVFQAVVSVETLTMGFDAPNIDMIALMRPTMSPVLHVQMLGRGMRTYEGKKNCLVLDFAGNVQRLGPVDAVIAEQKAKKDGRGKGAKPTKVCPDCSEIVSIRATVCPACGYKFPKKVKLMPKAQVAPLLKSQMERKIQIRAVNKITYTKHNKRGKPPSMKVTYICGTFNFFHEWIAFEHQGYPKSKAAAWWRQRTDAPVPATIDEALRETRRLREPTKIVVEQVGKYPEIIKYDF